MATTGEREAAVAPPGSAPIDRPRPPARFVICLHGRVYPTPFPVDLGPLAVIGPQIALGPTRREAAGTSEQIGLAGAIWNAGLKADVVTHAGTVVSGQVDAAIIALQEARDN